MILYLTAFLTGLFGSFHCAGMCGPLAFAIPGGNHKSILSGRILYNISRVLVYALLGILMGTFGLGLKMAGLQQSISIAVGVVLLLSVSLQYTGLFRISANPLSWISGKWIHPLFKSGTLGSMAVLGMLNGLLPCGFVYMALLGAGVTQGPLEGALFMICFGAGTFPMMLLVSMAGQILPLPIRSWFSRMSPVFAMLIALLFILRGMNLGIPYLSPQAPLEMLPDSLCH